MTLKPPKQRFDPRIHDQKRRGILNMLADKAETEEDKEKRAQELAETDETFGSW